MADQPSQGVEIDAPFAEQGISQVRSASYDALLHGCIDQAALAGCRSGNSWTVRMRNFLRSNTLSCGWCVRIGTLSRGAL